MHFWLKKKKKNPSRIWNATWQMTNLHAVCEHDADSNEFGEDPKKLRVGEHAVLQAVVKEAGVVAKHVINVWRLEKHKIEIFCEKGLSLGLKLLERAHVWATKSTRNGSSGGWFTYRFQVVLHDVPGGLDHLKHHVVLDVLHKVEHALSEGKRRGKPEPRGVQMKIFFTGWFKKIFFYRNSD